MSRGDHIFVWRFDAVVPYQHHAIDVGDGTVVHYTGEDGRGARVGGAAQEFQVRRTSIDRFVGSQHRKASNRSEDDRLHVVSHKDGMCDEVIVTRALAEVGRGGYSLPFRNCEHFATWASTGRWQSNQVDVVVGRAGAVAAKTALVWTGRLAKRRWIRGLHPTGLAGDAVQFAVESIGPHAGLRDAQSRRRVGQGASLTTCVVLGAIGGPMGAMTAGAAWGLGEAAGLGCRTVLHRWAAKDRPA